MMLDDSGQAGVIEITPQMRDEVLAVLRASGLVDHVSVSDGPLAYRICRTVLGAARVPYKNSAISHQ